MERIDALGPRPDRRAALAPLLEEADDAELQRIVEQAAEALSFPMAIATLVLDEIQFFKAHKGLPADLAAARATRRDVSFCQFVVRDGESFEVSDAKNDARVPQALVEEYGIASYLGMPIQANGIVVGSLCVLDTEQRKLTDAHREKLAQLAHEVDQRLVALVEQRKRALVTLTGRAVPPAFEELRTSLLRVRELAQSGLPALETLRSFLRMSKFVEDGGATSEAFVRRGRNAALEAIESTEALGADLEAAAADCEDCAAAIEQLVGTAAGVSLSEVVLAAQDLARHVTRPVGGAHAPDFAYDPVLLAPRALAVGLTTAVLTATAARLAEAGSSGGISLTVSKHEASVEVAISAPADTSLDLEARAAEIGSHIRDDPSVRVTARDGAVRLLFALRS